MEVKQNNVKETPTVAEEQGYGVNENMELVEDVDNVNIKNDEMMEKIMKTVKTLKVMVYTLRKEKEELEKVIENSKAESNIVHDYEKLKEKISSLESDLEKETNLRKDTERKYELLQEQYDELQRENMTKIDDYSTNDLKVKEYIKKKPEALGESEHEYEMLERGHRKNNVFMLGMRMVGKGIKEEVKEWIKEKMGLNVQIHKVTSVAGGLVLELQSFENKLLIMRKKKSIRRSNVWLRDDLTEREKEIEDWLVILKEEEEKEGNKVQIGYMKVCINGRWYLWDEQMGELIDHSGMYYWRGYNDERHESNNKKKRKRNK